MELSIYELKNNILKEKKIDGEIFLKYKDLSSEIISDLKFNISGNVYKLNDDIFIEFCYFSEFDVACGRCLKTMRYTLDNKFSSTLKEIEEDYDFDINLVMLKNDIIDISKLLYDDFIINLPSVFLCDDKCLGLCVNCGIDLNFDSCLCINEYENPAFAKLKDLFK